MTSEPPPSDKLSGPEWQRARNLQVAGAARGAAPQRSSSATGPRPERLVVDPSRTDVFRRGPDGKLHPIAGWHTTGPFAFGEWGRNIDWAGTAGDLADIATQSIGAGALATLPSRMGLAGAMGGGLTRADGAGLASGLYQLGKTALEGLTEPPEKRR
ncbi:MAG: hypothetical protein EPO51_16500 [Phenylobacterium sp.]|uniref:hypothetical protein n=1 Tax=Phenylobacterium sp. TaxID=1871053 RepID=UPI001223BFB8|nr:hypothetical protein [Phenylobacterium sp.]TAJ70689.1 MAG: hypothetical protein EPO51_16500 [Phenylobacterium sp.]